MFEQLREKYPIFIYHSFSYDIKEELEIEYHFEIPGLTSFYPKIKIPKKYIKIEPNKEYLDTLNIGVHTLDVYFSNGGVAQTTFTIAKVTTRIIENSNITKAVNRFNESTSSKSKSSNNTSNKTANTNNNGENSITNEDVNNNKTEKTTKTTKSNKKTKQSNTNDNIMTYVIIGSISLLVIALIIFIVFLKKKNKKDDFNY